MESNNCFNNFYLKFCEVFSIIDDAAMEYKEGFNNMLLAIKDFLQTETGMMLRQIILDKAKENNITIKNNSFFKAEFFTDGVVVGIIKEYVKPEDLKPLEELLQKEENKLFILGGEKFYKTSVNVINSLDTACDMFFSYFYTCNGMKKKDDFWMKYEEQLKKMNIDIRFIESEMKDLHKLRKIRNAYQHKAGNADEKFTKIYKLNNNNFDISKILIDPKCIISSFVSGLKVMRFFLKSRSNYTVENMINTCSNWLDINREYKKNGKA